MVAWLETHKDRRALCSTPCFLQRHDLGVRSTEFSVISLSHKTSVTHDHTADERIGVHMPPALARERPCPLQVRQFLTIEVLWIHSQYSARS